MPKQRKRASASEPSAARAPSPVAKEEKDAKVAEAHVRGLLRYLGEDPRREGLLETPARYVRALSEHFSGYALDPGA